MARFNKMKNLRGSCNLGAQCTDYSFGYVGNEKPLMRRFLEGADYMDIRYIFKN